MLSLSSYLELTLLLLLVWLSYDCRILRSLARLPTSLSELSAIIPLYVRSCTALSSMICELANTF